MRKLVTVVLVGLLAFGVLGPASAKKKKPKKPVPVDLQYFLRMDEACEAPFLSLTDAEDGDCIYGDGGFSAVYEAAGVDLTARYVAADGLPIVLDPTRKVTGTITIRGWNTYGGVGPAEIDITLIATIAGEEKEIGAYSESYTAAPGDVKTITLDLPIDPALAGMTVGGLTLAVKSHGTTVGGRGVEHDEPVSSITVPALK